MIKNMERFRRLEKELRESTRKVAWLKPFRVREFQPGLVFVLQAPTVDPDDAPTSRVVLLARSGEGLWLCAKLSPWLEMAGKWDYVLNVESEEEGFSTLVELELTEYVHEQDLPSEALSGLPGKVVDELLETLKARENNEAPSRRCRKHLGADGRHPEQVQFKQEEGYFMERLRLKLHEGWTGEQEKAQLIYRRIYQAPPPDPERIREGNFSTPAAMAAHSAEHIVRLDGLRTECVAAYVTGDDGGQVSFSCGYIPAGVKVAVRLYDPETGLTIPSRSGEQMAVLAEGSEKVRAPFDLPDGLDFDGVRVEAVVLDADVPPKRNRGVS